MDIREFRYYQYLAEKGYVEALVCYNDSEHGILYAKLDEKDNPYLYCLACEYKILPGLTFEQVLRRRIKEVNNDRI